MRSWANTIEQACKATVALDVSLEKARALHRVGTEDTLGYRSLCKAVDDVNTGKVMLLCGKVVSVEGKEGE
jgi:dihydroneopterin aldolase